MKIAIAGAGMAGAYLYRLLKEEGFGNVDLFDIHRTTRCGLRPCAWGFAPSSEYHRLISKYLEPEQYVLRRSNAIVIDGVTLKADMLSIDKPKLIQDLYEGADVRYAPLDPNEYDRIIDATGVARAYLEPTTGRELIVDCVQYRVSSTEELGLWFKTSSLGYEWCFPLDGDEYHLGFGNVRSDVESYRPSVLVDHSGQDVSVRCKCSSKIRLTSPYYSQPFVSKGRTIGIGESIGAVAPLGGDGIPYAMQCAEMLLDNWDDLDRYSATVLRKFQWMKKERQALDKLIEDKMPSISDVRTFTQHGKRVGIEMGLLNALSLFKKSLEKE